MDTRKLMRVENIEESAERIVVETTGARYIIEKAGKKGKIECYQMINKERFMACAEFDMSFSGACIEHSDESVCVISFIPMESDCRYARIMINRDSMMDIFSETGMAVRFSGGLLPDYSAEKNGHMLMIDEIGGIGIYPCRKLEDFEIVKNGKDWSAWYELGIWGRLLVSVFPPRKFSTEQSYADRIYFRPWCTPDSLFAIDPIPSDGELEEASRYTNIVVLIDTLWKGRLTGRGLRAYTKKEVYEDGSCNCYDYVPIDEERLVRAIEKAHSLNMRIIPYMSPYYSTARVGEYLKKVDQTIKKYGFDGVYCDGVSRDVLESYETVKSIREIVGDKFMYVHCTGDPLSPHIYCPFIDTYADFILRAEHIHNFTDGYLRYVISGYNISNAIGTVDLANYTPEMLDKLIDAALKENARFYLPYVGKESGKNEVLLKEKYYTQLDRRKKEQEMEAAK